MITQNKTQQGFTLIELMISIVLGLLVIAAGLSIYLSGHRSLMLQNGMGELQQNTIFGLALVTHDIRHANLNGNQEMRINPTVEGSGIVFATTNLPQNMSQTANLFSQAEATETATNQNSDRLTIQFRPGRSMSNCEGQNLSAKDSTVMYVQKYHVAQMLQSNGSEYTPKRFGLYCKAYSYSDSSRAALTPSSNNENGQLIMPDVDAFKVKLGVKAAGDTMTYMPISTYASAASGDVVSVNLGVLVRSSSPVGPDSKFNNDQTFDLFNNGDSKADSYGQVTLRKEQKTANKYLRNGYSQLVVFRNTAGVV
ncbi:MULTISPECIES: PilW family protein [unclassified Acinetobacter]|uniref:PilW family protein n=1 Tax=unclassified Acinetobacter TaxID=196816 RepID=UPI0035BA0B9B